MTTATLERPEVVLVESDEDAEHIVCCDEDTSLCGLDVSGDELAGDYDDEDGVCELCVRVAGEPCGDPRCPLLPWWKRVWR